MNRKYAADPLHCPHCDDRLYSDAWRHIQNCKNRRDNVEHIEQFDLVVKERIQEVMEIYE